MLSGAVVAILAIAATKSDTFHVRRSISIEADPERIAAQIIDFRKWTSWSPYEKYDPAMKRSFSDPSTGKGALYEWRGNSDIGAGRMEITGVSPSMISIKLDFLEPMEAHNLVEFTLKPEGKSTKLTWEMHGPLSFIGKVIHVFIDMDRMVGRDFEAGLENLKSIAES